MISRPHAKSRADWRAVAHFVVVPQCILLACALSVCAGEKEEPLKPVVPPVPAPVVPKIAPPQVPVAQRPPLSDAIADLQGTDKAKQDAAAKTLIDAGQQGFLAVTTLLKHANADVAKRATEVQQEIEKRSHQKYEEVVEQDRKAQGQPLTVQGLEELRQAWLQMALYAPSNDLRKLGIDQNTRVQKRKEKVAQAALELEEWDRQIKADATLKGLKLAAMEIERARVLNTLQRSEESLAAVEKALKESGATSRLTPSALQLKAETLVRLNKSGEIEAVCKLILQNFPRSLETRFAHKMLIDVYTEAKRWDEAMALAKANAALFPDDGEIQDTNYGLLSSLMEDAYDYKRVAAFSEWFLQTLPLERLNPEIPKFIGGCNEYILKDYAKAERGYTLMRDQFPDLIDQSDMVSALARVKMKMAGKFPKEAGENEADLAGTFGQFLKAIRTRDAKALADLVPKESIEDFTEQVTEGGEELVPSMTFADYVIKKIDVDEKEGTAEIVLDYYEAASDKPRELKQTAVKEDGKWKIEWEDPELIELNAANAVPDEGVAPQTTPSASTIPAIPK